MRDAGAGLIGRSSLEFLLRINVAKTQPPHIHTRAHAYAQAQTCTRARILHWAHLVHSSPLTLQQTQIYLSSCGLCPHVAPQQGNNSDFMQRRLFQTSRHSSRQVECGDRPVPWKLCTMSPICVLFSTLALTRRAPQTLCIKSLIFGNRVSGNAALACWAQIAENSTVHTTERNVCVCV